MKTMGIFQGKQANHNKAILETLYDYGPLSVWEIVGKLTKTNKVSLNATLCKSIRSLEKKGYVAKRPDSSKWLLNVKGVFAVLTVQEKYKPLGKAWDNIIGTMNLNSELKENYEKSANWEKLAVTAKNLTASGVINWDVIKNQTLAALIVAESEDSILDILTDSDSEARKEIVRKYLAVHREGDVID